jgi:hypothetical protein
MIYDAINQVFYTGTVKIGNSIFEPYTGKAARAGPCCLSRLEKPVLGYGPVYESAKLRKIFKFSLTKGCPIYIVTVGVTEICKNLQEMQNGLRVISYSIRNCSRLPGTGRNLPAY